MVPLLPLFIAGIDPGGGAMVGADWFSVEVSSVGNDEETLGSFVGEAAVSTGSFSIGADEMS